MEHVSPTSLNPSLSSEGALVGLLEFLESLQEAEEKPGSALAASVFQQVAPGSLKGEGPIKFSHQIQLLKILHKTKTELDELLEKMEGKNEKAPVSSNPKNEPNKEEGLSFSAKTLDRKAFEVLLKKEKFFSPFTASLEKGKTERSTSSISHAPENVENETKENRLSSAFRTLLTFLDPRNLEKPPTAEFVQKMKPFLEHLIVVVETQENMSKPSQKLVRLVRHLSENSSFLKALAWNSLFKPESAECKVSQAKRIMKDEGSSLEKAKHPEEGTSSRPLFPSKNPKQEGPSFSQPSMKEVLSFSEELKKDAQRLFPKEVTPWAAPYNAPKPSPRSRFKDKKKEKGKFRRKEEEDLETDR